MEKASSHSDSELEPGLVIDFTAGEVESEPIIDRDDDVEMATPSESVEVYNYLDLEADNNRELSPIRLSKAEEDRLLEGSEIEYVGSPEVVTNVMQAITYGPAMSPMPQSDSELGACGGKKNS